MRQHGPLTADVMKCQLGPMRREDYPVTFTDDQWQRLQAAFPGGCATTASPGSTNVPPSPGSLTRTPAAA